MKEKYFYKEVKYMKFPPRCCSWTQLGLVFHQVEEVQKTWHLFLVNDTTT